MLSLSAGNRDILRSSVRKSLKALVAGQPIWLAGNWTQCLYSTYMQSWLNHVCNACTFSTGTFDEMFELFVEVRDDDLANQATLNSHIAYSMDPTHNVIGNLIQNLQTCDAAQRRVAMCAITFEWMNNQGVAYPYGHSAVWIFDFRQRVQIFFDPEDGLDQAYSLCKAFAALPPLLAGWTVASAAQTCEALLTNSLQKWFESTIHQEEQGICGLMVVLVCWVCVRFQYFNPLKVSQLIKAAFPSESARSTFLLQYISWYQALIEDIQAGTAQRSRWFPAVPDVPCQVVSPTTGRLCSRGACRPPNDIVPSWCWQHRSIVGNHGSPNKKCNAPQQASCRLQGH